MPFTVIATALVGSLGAAAVSVTATILAVGANYLLANRTAKNKKRRFTAFQGETVYGSDIQLQLAFGVVLTKGHEVRYFKWGSGNKFNASVIQLADFECDGLEPYVFMNGEKYNLIAKTTIGSEVEHWGIDGFEDLTSIRFYDGSFDQTVDTKLVSDTANLGSIWKSTSAGEGICYVVFEREYSSKWEFEPEISWVLRGAKCYDPRKDSTVSGGSGDHRIDDPSTYEFTTNPALQRLTYLYGFRAPLTGSTLVGMGKSASEIDINAHIAAANVADTDRIINANTVKTYECNVLVNSGDDFSEVLETIDDSMAAYSANRGGIASVIVGAPQITTFDITDDDIRQDEGDNYRPKRNIDDLVNKLSGQYTNIEAQFNPESLTTISVNADITEDNGERLLQKDLLQINDPDIAQYVLQILYRQNRLGASFSLPITNRKYLGINAGDWGTYDGRTWMVMEKSGGRIVLEEKNAEMYASEGIIPGPVPVVPTAPINPSLISTLQGFAASSGFIEGGDASSIPAIQLAWTPPEDPSIVGITVTYNVQGEADFYSKELTNVESGSATITENVMGGRVYEVSALIRTVPDRFRVSTATISTSTPTVSAAVVLEQLQQDTKDTLTLFSERLKALGDAVRETSGSMQEISAAEHIQRETVSAAVDGAFAAIVQEASARVTGDEATADALLAVIAEIDTEIAQGYLSFNATVDEQGGSVEIAIVGRASLDEGVTFEEVGTFYRVTPDGNDGFDTEIINRSENWSLLDGNDNLIFGSFNGEIISNAIIRNAADTFRIDPIAGQILISDGT